jgi:YD repeat-containing protein
LWTSKFTYTAFNQVATRKDARGVVTSFGYDVMNRLTTMGYDVSQAPGVASTPSVNYNYDNSSTGTTKGLLLSITMTSGGSTIYTESFSYDLLDRLQQRSWTRDGRTYTIGYEYNTAGQLTKLTYPSGRQVGINHDGKGRLVSMTEPNGGTPVPAYISNITLCANHNETTSRG